MFFPTICFHFFPVTVNVCLFVFVVFFFVLSSFPRGFVVAAAVFVTSYLLFTVSK